MATPKTLTAYDAQQHRLVLLQQGTAIHVERAYSLVDDVGDALDPPTGGKLVTDIQWSAVPAGVQAALTTINTWTYNQILSKEGMT
jgi:hypothetical protein